MPIMPYTSNPQINSTGRSLKEHVFRSQFIAFVVFSSLFPKPRNAKHKIKAENRRWTAENVYAFNFPFTAFRLTENVCGFFFVFRMRESENGKRKRRLETVFSFLFCCCFPKHRTGKQTTYECWKQKRESRKAEDVFRFRFFCSFLLYRQEKRRTVNKNGNRKCTAETVLAVNFLLLLFFQYMNKGKRKMKQKGKSGRRFPFFLSVFCERKQKRKPFSFSVFCFPSFSLFWKRKALHWKWILKRHNRKRNSIFRFVFFIERKMGKWIKEI